MTFYQVTFAGGDAREVHLDKILQRAALGHQAPEERVEACPQVEDLDGGVAGLEELVDEEANAHDTGIVAQVDLGRAALAPLHHKRQQRVGPVAQAHSG